MNERNDLDQAFADRDHAREERDTFRKLYSDTCISEAECCHTARHLIADLLSAREELATLKAELEKWKQAVEAWKAFHYGGGLPEDRGVHDTDKHPRTCGRWSITNPKESPVEAYMCGDIYNPSARCTCGADPTRKELRERAEKAERLNSRLQPYVQQWQPIETAPERRKVFVTWINGLGKRRTALASYWPEGTLDMADEVPDIQVNEEGQNLDAGWWEESEGNEEAMFRLVEKFTHWMPLPLQPCGLIPVEQDTETT